MDTFTTPNTIQDYAPAKLLPQETEPFPWTLPDEHFFRLLKDEPLQIMSLVSRVAKLLKPCDKEQKEAFKHETMMRLNTLMRRGTLRRFKGHLVCLPNWRPHDDCLKARTITLIDKFRGSVNRFKKREIKPSLIAAREMAERIALAPPEKPKALRRPRKPVGPPPTWLEKSAAAGVLAVRERPGGNKWAGYFRGKRVRHKTPFRLRNGTTRYVFAIRGGKIYFAAPAGSGRMFDEFDIIDLSRMKNPCAVTLGRSKRGVKECPSELKKLTSRANGRKPCHAGRKRGRPAKHVDGPLEGSGL